MRKLLSFFVLFFVISIIFPQNASAQGALVCYVGPFFSCTIDPSQIPNPNCDAGYELPTDCQANPLDCCLQQSSDSCQSIPCSDPCEQGEVCLANDPAQCSALGGRAQDCNGGSVGTECCVTSSPTPTLFPTPTPDTTTVCGQNGGRCETSGVCNQNETNPAFQCGGYPSGTVCCKQYTGSTNTVKFDCNNNNCTPTLNQNATFPNLGSCWNSGCEKVSCVNGSCVSNSNGEYLSTTECNLAGCGTFNSYSNKVFCDLNGNPTSNLLDANGNPNRFYTAIGCISADNVTPFTLFLLSWGTGVGGGVAFIFIVFASFLIMTSAGNPEKLRLGKVLLVSAISGLMLILLSVYILRIVGVNILNIPGL